MADQDDKSTSSAFVRGVGQGVASTVGAAAKGAAGLMRQFGGPKPSDADAPTAGIAAGGIALAKLPGEDNSRF